MALEFDKETTQEQDQQNQVTYGDRLEQEEPEKPTVPEFDNLDDDIDVPEEDAQLDLFGGEDKKDKKETKAAPPKSAPKSTPKKSQDQDQKVNTAFTVYYAGHQVAVPEDGMTLENLRRYLESDFPELSKDRTRMTVDIKKNQVVPIVQGAKKG